MISLILLLLTAFVGFLIYVRQLTKTKPKNFPPGPPILPVWGGYWFLLLANYNFTHKAIDILAKWYRSPLVGLFAGPAPVVLVTGHQLVKEAINRDEFAGRPDIYATRYRTLGELLGVSFTDGEYWKGQRRFALRHLRDFGFGRRFPETEQAFESEIKALIDYISSKPQVDDHDIHLKQGYVLIPDLFYGLLCNAILRMLVGRRFDDKSMRELSRSSASVFKTIDTTGRVMSITPWIRHLSPEYFGSKTLRVENERLRDFFLQIIRERQETFSDDHHGDFIDKFISKMRELQGNNLPLGAFTEKQLVWVVADFFIPSPNVIGPTLNMLWALLCNHPEVQAKVLEEVDRVVGRGRLPNLDDRKNMPYTEAVIRESMRLEPVTPVSFPRRCLEDTTLGGYFIPKHTFLLISIWNSHRDPELWDEPDKFKPERFLDADGNLLKRDASVPFGGGKRLCAGETFARQTMFLIVSGLLQNFRFEAVDGAPNLQKRLWGFISEIPPFWVKANSR